MIAGALLFLSFVHLASNSDQLTTMIFCAGLLFFNSFSSIISNLLEVYLMKDYPEILNLKNQKDSNYMSIENSQLQSDVAYYWVVMFLVNSFISTALTWLYNKKFLCPDFESTFEELENGGGSVSSSASPRLVGFLLFFNYFQVVWSITPFLSIPFLVIIMKKLDERAIVKASTSDDSKKVNDADSKVKNIKFVK